MTLASEPTRRATEPTPTRPRVLYVAGYGRSGSTVLDIALSSHPEIEGFGELAGLFAELAADSGGPGPFWAGIASDVGADVGIADEAGWEMAAAVAGRAERLVPRRALLPHSAAGRRTVALNGAVLDRLGRQTGATWLVDSSKSSWIHSWRLPLLTQTGADVRCLILVRDLDGVVRSVRGGRGDTQARQRLPTARAVIGWSLANLTALVTGLGWCGQTGTRLVHYRDLAEQPGPTLHGIATWLDLPASPAVDTGVEHGFRPGHQLQGNRVRRQPLVRIGRPGPARGQLDPWSRAIVAVVGPLVTGLLRRMVPPLRAVSRPTARAG